jgi:hypothetical protein
LTCPSKLEGRVTPRASGARWSGLQADDETIELPD